MNQTRVMLLISSKAIKYVLGVGVVINTLLLAGHVALRQELRSHGQGEQFPVLSGVDTSGARWKSDEGSPCHVIRMTSEDCRFCEADADSYAQMISAAKHSSCEVIEIAPEAGRITTLSQQGIVRLVYVDKDLGQVVQPFITPHTIVLDGRWSVKWMRRGVFDKEALSTEIAAVNSLKKDGHSQAAPPTQSLQAADIRH